MTSLDFICGQLKCCMLKGNSIKFVSEYKKWLHQYYRTVECHIMLLCQQFSKWVNEQDISCLDAGVQQLCKTKITFQQPQRAAGQIELAKRQRAIHRCTKPFTPFIYPTPTSPTVAMRLKDYTTRFGR